MDIRLNYEDIGNMVYIFKRKPPTKELEEFMEKNANSYQLEAFTEIKDFLL